MPYASDRCDNGEKLQHYAVAGGLDDAAAEVAHDRPRRLKPFTHRLRRLRHVLVHETRVAVNTGYEGRCEPAHRDHCSGTPALRRASRLRSIWTRYVGSSLIAVQAAPTRETV